MPVITPSSIIPGDPADRLARRILDLERQIAEIRTARIGNRMTVDGGTGITIKGGGLRIEDGDGNLLITLDANGLTTTPQGRISDTSLASPSTFNATYGDTTNTDLTTAGVDLAVCSLTVPAEFSRALVVVNVSVGVSRVVNAVAAPFYTYAWIEGAPLTSATIAAHCQGGCSMTLSTAWVAGLSDLTEGQSIQAGATGLVDSTSGWTARSANGHSVMYATFMR